MATGARPPHIRCLAGLSLLGAVFIVGACATTTPTASPVLARRAIAATPAPIRVPPPPSYSAAPIPAPVPVSPEVAVTSPARALAPASRPVTGWKTHVVISGDTLWAIARAHRTSVQALLDANPRIADPRLIHPGDRVAIAPRVILHGDAFFARATDSQDARRCGGTPAAPVTVTDAWFLPRQHCWNEGTVWWESANAWQAPGAWIEIVLDGTYEVDSALVQADDNDTYLLSYRDGKTGEWVPLWHVPLSSGGGMHTRPNPNDDGERKILPDPVVTDALRLEASSGDGMYSVSEIQVFGARSNG